MREKDSYERAMRRAIARKPFLDTDGQCPSREEVHDRARFGEARPLRIRPAPHGSGRRDVSQSHDRYLAKP